jgi:hypothetical protein
MRRIAAAVAVLLPVLVSGCMRYLTHDREKVLLEGVDIDQTLQIAEMELQDGGWGCVLGVWAIRDQVINRGQAEEVARLYRTYVPSLDRQFNVWHLTWAIADMYRLGDEQVKEALDSVYQDARARAKALHRVADKHANGDKLYMGDAHSGGRAYAKRHVVMPGRKGYVQSVDEYRRRKAKE